MPDINNDFILQYYNFDQIGYMQWKLKKSNEQILLEIKNDWEKIDSTFRNSKERKQLGYRVKGYVSRKIKTVFGTVEIIRTKYEFLDSKNQRWRTICFIDHQLGIERYKQLSLHLKLAVLEHLGKGKTLQTIADSFRDAGLNKVMVSRIARNIDVRDLNQQFIKEYYKVPKDTDDKPYIYLNVDDTFSPLRNENKERENYRIRLVVAHMGFTYEDSKKRKTLLNKRAFFKLSPVNRFRDTDGSNLESFSKEIMKSLEDFYGDISNKKLIVCGDGALWIKRLAVYLGADFVLDKYHATSAIYRLFPLHRKKTSNIYEKCYEFLNQGNINKLIEYLTIILDNKLFPDRNSKLKQLIKYFENNISGVENYQKPYYIGSQTEAMVSHIVKSLKGYGAKIYHEQTFRNLLNLKTASINDFDPLMIYQKTANILFLK